jgi:molecular chaperone IbpA
MRQPNYTYSKVVSDLVNRGEEVINNFWNVLDHPDFPFVTLTSTTNGARNFPPYNIIESDGKVRLEMAVAGYSKDRLTVELEGNLLLVRGTPLPVKETDQYRHKGIANTAFLRTFDMNKNIVIETVSLADGLLVITFSTVVPEEKKRTTFEIK